jgi:ABC-type multidrug transport system fused ATPase/permease subunit
MPPENHYLRLLNYVKPHWRVFLLAILTMVILAVSEAGLPALMKPMLDGSFVQKDANVIRWVPLALVALFVLRGIAGFASSYAMAYIGNRVVADLRLEMFNKLLGQPTPFYDDTPRGSLVATVAYNVQQLTMAATVVLTTLVKDVLSVVVLMGWLLYLNWKLTLVTLALTPFVLLVFRIASHRLRYTSREIQKNVGNLTQILEETIGGNKIIKIFDAQDYERPPLRCRQSAWPALRHEADGRRRSARPHRPVPGGACPGDHRLHRHAASQRRRDHRRRLHVLHGGHAAALRATETPVVDHRTPATRPGPRPNPYSPCSTAISNATPAPWRLSAPEAPSLSKASVWSTPARPHRRSTAST